MTVRLDTASLVTVFGGAGFLGRHTVRALARQGYRIRAAERRPELAGHLQPMGNVGQIHAVQANLRYPETVGRAVAGAGGAVNFVGILDERGKQSFQAVHVDGARAVARAARDAGVEVLVHVSALGADRDSPARYARTKALGEDAVLEEFPDAVILRPSIVFGPEDDFFNRFAAMARFAPALPLIGGGRTRFQPVYVGDVARAIAAVFQGKATSGTIYELGGPETLSFRQLLERVLKYTGRDRGFVSMPFALAKLQALLMSPLPSRPITVDQVRMLRHDNVVSEAARNEKRTLEALGVDTPTAIELIVPDYLERFNPRGQYSHYRP